jgi:hypothetical protein
MLDIAPPRFRVEEEMSAADDSWRSHCHAGSGTL